MMKAISIALVLAGLFTACGKSPTGPTSDPPSEPRFAAPPGTVFEIAGPDVVPLGAKVQFSLIAQLPDGSSRDVTNEARWSRGRALLLFLAPGLAMGLGSGETSVTADFDGNRPWKEVMVLPAGTYRLTGYVYEVDQGSVWVEGARVEVTTGVGAPLTMLTDFWGRYVLYGVSGETSVRVTKDGYMPAAQTVIVTDHQRYDIELRLPGPRRDVQGIYTMTITAANHCAVGRGEGHLPEEARVRTYKAAVRQYGPRLDVTLSGATFRGYEGAYGRVEPERVFFDFTWYDGYLPLIVEQLSTSRLLIVSGSVAATGTDSRLFGMLTGRISETISETNDVWAGPNAWCDSTSHQFELTR